MSKKALLITSVDDENLLLNNTQAKKIVLDYSFFLKNNIHENNVKIAKDGLIDGNYMSMVIN